MRSRRLSSRVLLALTLALALLLAGDGVRRPSPGADAAAGRAGAIRAALTEAARLAHGISRGQARLVYEAALRQAELAADRNAQAAALAGLGDLVSPRLYHGRALALYRRSEHLATGPQADLSAARVHFATGVEEAGRQRWAEADRHYQAALILLQRRGDLAMLARVEDAVGNVALRQGDPARAERAYQASLQTSLRTGDLATISRTLGNLSLVDALRGDRSRERTMLERALAAARASGDRDRIATALNGFGSFLLDAADYEQALDCFEQAVAVHPEDEAELAYSLNNLGIVLAEQSEDGLAVERFERSLTLLEKVGDVYGVVRLVNNLGAVCQENGEYARALQYHLRALQLALQSGESAAVPGHWYNIGSARELAGQPGQARAAYRESLATAGPVGDRMHAVAARLGLARLAVARGDPGTARQLAERAAALATSADMPELFWQARTLTGRALRKLRQPTSARRALLDAIQAVEQIRARVPESMPGERRLFLARRLEPYHELIEILIARGETAPAFAWSERVKARALLDRCAARRGPAEPAPAAPAERMGEKRTPLSGRLLAASATPAVMLRTLPGVHDPVLLEYVVTPVTTYLFTLTAGRGAARPRLRVHPIAIGARELTRAVEEFHHRVATRNLEYASQAKRLYDLLIGPAAPEVAARSDLIIVPDGALWHLPFQALESGSGDTLLMRHAVLYAPSLTLLHLIATPETAVLSGPARAHPGASVKTLLALGNPALSRTTVSLAARRGASGVVPLPETEQEVRSIARLYGKGRGRVYTGALATKQAILDEASGFGVLHLATHALLDDRDPMRSGLLLADSRQGRGGDGLLTARELERLSLPADLVVLSGCQTVGGQVGDGEGVIGLAWALFAAGAGGVVASQWSVESDATRDLMVELHRGLRSDLTAAESLRRAALAIAGEPRYRHPFYWAGFILLGAGDSPARRFSSTPRRQLRRGEPGEGF